MAKTKNKPGRPRSVPKPEGMDRTALAHHLNLNVKVIDRWLREGVPCTRYNGRVYFDLLAVEAWREEYESREREPSQAAVLHPDDPRYEEKVTAAKVKTFKHALEVGAMVSGESVVARFADALANLNSGLNAVTTLCGDLSLMNRDNAESELTGALQYVLSSFKPDRVDLYPESAFEVEDDSDAGEFESTGNCMPVLPGHDPRAAVARANTRRHRAELDTLEASCLTVADAHRMVRERCNVIRKRLKEVPSRVAARLASEGNTAIFVRACIFYELDVARLGLGGKYPVPPDADEESRALWANMRPLEPVPPSALDDEPLEDVDGQVESDDEFEGAPC